MHSCALKESLSYARVLAYGGAREGHHMRGFRFCESACYVAKARAAASSWLLHSTSHQG